MNRMFQAALAALVSQCGIHVAHAQTLYQVQELPAPAKWATVLGATAINEHSVVSANAHPYPNINHGLACDAAQCTPLPSLAQGSPDFDFVQDLNDDGVAVGASMLDRVRQAVIFSNGVAMRLGSYNDDPKIQSMANGVNGSGVVVGWGLNKKKPIDAKQKAFVWHSGQMTWIRALGGGSSALNKINEAGLAVGWAAHPTTGYARAFTYNTVTGESGDMGTVAGKASIGAAINNAGDIAGVSTTFKNEVWPEIAMRTVNGVMQSLGMLPGHHDSAAHGINDRGETVGVSNSYLPAAHAFLYDDNGMRDVNDLLSDEERQAYWISVCVDINNASDMACIGVNKRKGQNVAVILKRIQR